MTVKVGGISVTLDAVATPFVKAMGKALDKLNQVPRAAFSASTSIVGLGDAIARADERINQLNLDGIRNLGQSLAVAGAAGVAAIGALGYVGVKAASDFEESTNVIQQAFGDMAPMAETWAKETGAAMGRSTQQMRGFAGQLQAMLSPMIGNTTAAAKMSTQLSKLAVDLGSFWNVADDDALLALRSALSGETEPMRRFGVTMTEAALQQFALDKGMRVNVQTMGEAQKVALRYAFIMDRTAVAQGDAVRTSGSFANASKALTSTLENLAVSMGQVLLPIATSIVGLMKGIASSMDESSSTTKGLVVGLGVLFAVASAGTVVLGGLLVASSAVITAWTTLTAVAPGVAAGITTVMASLGPITAAIAAFTVAYLAASAVVDAFREPGERSVGIMDAMTSTIDSLSTGFRGFAEVVINIIGAVLLPFAEVLDYITRGIFNFGDGVEHATTYWATMASGNAAAGDAIDSMIKRMDAAQMALDEFGSADDMFQGLADAAIDADVPSADLPSSIAFVIQKEKEAEAQAKKYRRELERRRDALESLAKMQRALAQEMDRGRAGALGNIVAAEQRFTSGVIDQSKLIAKTGGLAGSDESKAGFALLQERLVQDLKDALLDLDFEDFQAGMEMATESLRGYGIDVADFANDVIASRAAIEEGTGGWSDAIDLMADKMNEMADALDREQRESDRRNSLEGQIRSGLFGDEKKQVSAATFDQQTATVGAAASFIMGGPGALGSSIGMAAAGPIGAIVGEMIVGALQSMVDSLVSGMTGALQTIFGDERLGAATGAATSTAASSVLPSMLVVPAMLVFSSTLISLATFMAIFGAAIVLLTWPFLVMAAVATALASALVVLVSAVLLWPAALGGVFAFFFELSKSTESFKEFQDGISLIIDLMIAGLEPFWRGLTPLVGLFATLVLAAEPLIDMFANLGGPLGETLFYAFKFMGLAALAVATVFGYVGDFFLWIMQGIAVLFKETFKALKDVGFNEQYKMWRGIERTIVGMQGAGDAFAGAFVDLANLTYEEAKRRGESIIEMAKENEARKELNEEIFNAPSGMKVVAARFRAINEEGGPGNAPPAQQPLSDESTTNSRVINLNIERAELITSSWSEVADMLNEAAEKSAFMNTGTTGTRDIQKKW